MRSLILLTSIALMFSCSKNENNRNLLTFEKSQGQCGETWGQTFLDYTQGQAITKATAFLENEDLEFEDLTLDSLEQISICITCHDCPSGWFYVLEAPESEEQNFIALGFKKR